jgi:ribonucleoside-diphosphate reductase alpha chain
VTTTEPNFLLEHTVAKDVFQVDRKIEEFEPEVYNTPMIQDIWKDKYLQPGETHPKDAYRRVAKAIANSPCEQDPKAAEDAFYQMMAKRLFLPGGRILAGAGTNKHVTLMNCYVNAKLIDSIEGIADGKRRLMITSAMGGGMGTSFETLRPYNAVIKRLGSASSGAVSFMDTFNADGKTIRSAGERRAAQMGTISDTHPDLPEFIRAKGEGLRDGTERLKEFNVSVFISDAFKAAVDDNEDWLLYFHVPPRGHRAPELVERDFEDDNGTQQYVYSIWRARELWDLITEYTYEYSDPGVIFGDRVNDFNNLNYCEEIRCTNPCGEQPLPPDGTCNLGAINVANVVRYPFTPRAEVNYDLLAKCAAWGVRFLDNVIEVTEYPLEEQRIEEFNKRRIGLGLTGLATMFAELQVRYGSHQSVQCASQVMKTICLAAYDESIRLADERGSFPLYQDIIVDCGFIKYRLDDERKELIVSKGLRNGVILTIAPVGTGSIALGNIPSGLEPDFALEVERRVRQNNSEEFKPYVEKSYTKRFYEFVTGDPAIPEYMVTAEDLSILDHIKVQAALQKWVDASTSKTINVPTNMPYEEFVEVYELAYQYGLKGCTTYRHSKWRDSILRKAGEMSPQTVPTIVKRPSELSGTTYKLKWPSLNASMFVTINYLDSKPYEILFASKDAKFQDWMTALTLMISANLRSGSDPAAIPRELKQVVSTHDTSWENGKHYNSLVHRIGAVIESDFIKHGIITPQNGIEIPNERVSQQSKEKETKKFGATCPQCSAPALTFQEGCAKCINCGYSKC